MAAVLEGTLWYPSQVWSLMGCKYQPPVESHQLSMDHVSSSIGHVFW
jgi:hypothetical protein